MQLCCNCKPHMCAAMKHKLFPRKHAYYKPSNTILIFILIISGIHSDESCWPLDRRSIQKSIPAVSKVPPLYLFVGWSVCVCLLVFVVSILLSLFPSELERLLEQDAGCRDMYEVVKFPDMIYI